MFWRHVLVDNYQFVVIFTGLKSVSKGLIFLGKNKRDLKIFSLFQKTLQTGIQALKSPAF